jgi:hypothetical protein
MGWAALKFTAVLWATWGEAGEASRLIRNDCVGAQHSVPPKSVRMTVSTLLLGHLLGSNLLVD